MTGHTGYVASASTTDVRAPLKAASGSVDRVAGLWYSSTTETFDVNLTDGQSHQLALYMLDWGGNARVQSIVVADAASNVTLDSEALSSFHNGVYDVWNVTGHVKIVVTYTGPAGGNAAVSGIFFGGGNGSTVPSSPSSVTATTSGGNAVVSWQPSAGATSYNVYRGTTSGGEASTPIASGISTTSYTDSTATAYSKYYYTVVAVNAIGGSGTSSESAVTVSPIAPTGVTTVAGDKDVLLTWTAYPGATGYNVYRSTTSGSGYSKVNSTPLTACAYLDLDAALANGTSYYYVVTALAPTETPYSVASSAIPVAQNGKWTIVYTNGSNSASQSVVTAYGTAMAMAQNGSIRAASAAAGTFSTSTPLTSTASTAGQWTITWVPNQQGALPTLLVLTHLVFENAISSVVNANGTASVVDGNGAVLMSVTYPNSLSPSSSVNPGTTSWNLSNPLVVTSTLTMSSASQQPVTGGWTGMNCAVTLTKSCYTSGYFQNGGNLTFVLPATSSSIQPSIVGSSTSNTGIIQATANYKDFVTTR